MTKSLQGDQVEFMTDIDHFVIGNDIALPELYVLSKSSLCDRSRIVAIDMTTPSLSHTIKRAGAAPILRRDLQALLECEHLALNCFAIYTCQTGEDWRMRYLGVTTIEDAAADLAASLLPGAARHSAVHVKCRDAVWAGCQIGLRMIHIEPDTLRHFVQDKMLMELRSSDTLDWHSGFDSTETP